MNIAGSNILITGGAGFIGSSLAIELVKKQARVTILDSMIAPYGGNFFNIQSIKKKVKFIKEDIRNSQEVKKAIDGKDFIFHLAGQTGRVISLKKPKLDYDINCLGTLHVLKAVAKHSKKPKVVLASSRGVIGKPLYLPVDEKHPTFPRDPYGAHKLTAEHYCSIYSREFDVPVTILRFNNIYGPRCQTKSNHYGTINIFISLALQGKVLQIYGSGKQTRDYVYISDAVNALEKSMKSKSNNEIFFVGSNQEYSLLHIAKVIQGEIRSTQFEMVPYPREFGKLDFDRFSSSFDKINKALGWKPKVDLEVGIKKTIRYYKKNLKYYL